MLCQIFEIQHTFFMYA